MLLEGVYEATEDGSYSFLPTSNAVFSNQGKR